jgi:hypothetical protein
MYCAPSDIIVTTCGQHVLPIAPSKLPGTLPSTTGKDQYIQEASRLFQDWQASPCAWVPVTVPAYIVYGLLEQGSLLDKVANKSKGSQLAPQDQELHQQMLQKLALHLAAQPQAQHILPQLEAGQREMAATKSPETDTPALQKTYASQTAHPVHSSCEPMHPAQEKGSCSQKKLQVTETKEAKETKCRDLAPQEQEFQQEMLRKLALHLAAQEELPEEASSTSVDSKRFTEDADNEAVATPDLFPDTPSSFGEDQCERYFIGDDINVQAAEETVYCSQCVSVPMHIAYGLIENIPTLIQGHHSTEGPADFHQQMLQKLALHLAAQPEPLQASHAKEQHNPDQPLCSAPKVAWADMVDDDLDWSQPAVAVENDKNGMRRKEARGPSLSVNPKPSQLEHQEFQQEMLRKLALHLAAQPELPMCTEEAAFTSVTEAKNVGEDKARCDELIAELELSSDGTKAARVVQIVEMVVPGSRTLSLTPNGSRLVQKVIDIASAPQREQLLQELLTDVTELYTSPHANHVVAKLVEVMPAQNLAAIGEAMRGNATTVARHQFGSRILERLIEHCDENLIGFLLDELLEDFEALARHQFGNFVVARLLEHGTAARKNICMQKLLPYVLQHATHKTACNIVERMLDNADLSCQAKIVDAFLAGTGEISLEAIAATRYGSFVIQHLVNRFHPRIDAVKARVKAAHSQLQASAFSQRKIVQFLGDAFFRD